MSDRTAIQDKVRSKLLLWSERHCGFCGKECGTKIEIHHIDEDPNNNKEDNLIPVCFDCHEELPRYNPHHTRGTRYREYEIKQRREQIYDLYTRKYLRPVDIQISNYYLPLRIDQNGNPIPRSLGDVSCSVVSLSNDIPVQLNLKLRCYQGKEKLSDSGLPAHFKGKELWNLNPNHAVHSHFPFPFPEIMEPWDFRIEVEWSITDRVGRKHKMLPFSYRWDTLKIGDWWYHPATGPYHADETGK